MNKLALFIGLFLMVVPSLAFAQGSSCSAQGYTVVFVNGVFDTEDQAQSDANALQFKFGYQY